MRVPGPGAFVLFHSEAADYAPLGIGLGNRPQSVRDWAQMGSPNDRPIGPKALPGGTRDGPGKGTPKKVAIGNPLDPENHGFAL